MKLGNLSFFDLASERMRWLSARQQVVSENIANADTPGFRAREVSGFEELMSDNAPMQGLTRTQSNHIAGTTQAAGVRVHDDSEAWEASIDGNTVVLEQQIMKASDIADSYSLAADLYQKGHELLTLAATGRR